MTARLSILTIAYVALGLLAWAANFAWPYLVAQLALAALILALVVQAATRRVWPLLLGARCAGCLARTRRTWRGRYQCAACDRAAPVSCVEQTERVDDFTRRAA